jgi:uncharacterized repeat protein (TIGR02543 family)
MAIDFTTFKNAKRLYFVFAALFLAAAGCNFPDPFFVPVTAIEDVPAAGTAGAPLTLTATVRPGFASNSGIVWLVADAGTTGASVSGNVINTAANGTVIIIAKIANGKGEGKDFTQDFTIVFSGGLPAYTVHFETNGGGDIADQRVTEGQTAVRPASPLKSGFVFENWYSDPELTALYDFSTPVTGDITLYANWLEGSVFVTGVTLNKDSATLTAGETETLTATVAPDNATNKAVIWSTSDSAVAAVSGGIVTAVAAGTADITVTTADGNFTATCTVTVSAATIPVTSVTLNKSDIYLTVGAQETLTATVLPDNATNQAVTWSTSDSAVATVSGGAVTGVSAGTAVITVKTADGGKTASCTVNVSLPSPADITFPTAAAITYGAALSASALSGGTAGRGSFAWQVPSTIPPVTNSGYNVEFTPTDGLDYSGVAGWNGSKVVRTVAITVNKAAGAAVTAPTVSGTPAQTSITVNTVSVPANGQTVEYAILTANNGSPATWQSGTSFSGLSSGTTYYVYARSASNANYNEGTASVSAGIATAAPPQARITSTGEEYATLTDAMDAAANGTLAAPTEIVILRNITVSSGYTIPANKNIKLTVPAGQDYTITAAAGAFRLFSVSNASSSLTLGQAAGGGTLTLRGGNQAAAANRSGVYVNGSGRTFVLNDGVTITGFRSTSNGGGVYVNSNGTFTMNSGTISGNTASGSDGGGVYVNGTFTMNGGSISDNTTNLGGGVYVSTNGTFTMKGGSISGNTAYSGGGGVYVNGGTFTMSGGEIAGNSATGTGTNGRGGGVLVVGSSSTFTMSGGTIYGTDNAKTNTANGSAPKGVAVYLEGAATAKYGDGDAIVSGANNGVDITVMGHN